MTGVEEVFAEGGLFDRGIAGFNPRTSQLAMAQAVNDALINGGTLVVESGTGTGKTFAYLVPVLLSGKKTIISTGTRHLQDQIFYRDLPQVISMLGVDVEVQILKGRSNYLCRYRHDRSKEQADLVGRENQIFLDVIDEWSVRTRTGDIAEVSEVPEDSAVWKKVTSTTDSCLGAKCPDFSRCHVNVARRKALESKVVVVNHHLFFSDVSLKTDGFGELLPEHEAVVFDEAHSLAETASRFFGFSLSNFQIAELLDDITEAEKAEQSGVSLPLDVAAKACSDFQGAVATLARKRGGSLVDTRDNLADQALVRALEELKLAVSDLGLALARAAPAGEALHRCFERCQLTEGRLFAWDEERGSTSVCWLEGSGRMFRLHQTPLDISREFSGFMDRPGTAWVFTSATLAVGDDFSLFNHRVGLEEPETGKWDSPYDYDANSLLYLPADIPDPRSSDYPDALARVVLDVTALSQGRAFCLFTSYRMMYQVFERVRDKIEWPLLLQGVSSKQHLIDEFLQKGNAVLFGTASFWEGVDIQGDLLSCVIIDKLPFASPSDPVLKTRLAECENRGGNPFMEIQVPEAVITLKQGVGRLIRSESDTGVMVICDNRLLTRPYGRVFLNSLPAMPISQELGSVARFFSHSSS